MYKSTKTLLGAAVVAITLSACGAKESPSDGGTKLADQSHLEIRIGGKPSVLRTDRVGYYALGSAASKAEIAGWDIDIRPDGTGLPPGSGSAFDGDPIYQEKCAVCHGVFGEGVGRWPQLAGGIDTLAEDDPEKTVGSYWPYASTLWDYIHRAMPFQAPQSLTDDEVYALTAYVLYLNDLIDEDFEVNQGNLASIEMPNRDGFFEDPRPDSTNTACMSNCKDPSSIKVTWEAAALGVTPTEHFKDDEGEASAPIAAASAAHVGKRTYTNACASCHEAGIAGAPKIHDNADDWEKRIAAGESVLIDHAINGFSGSSGYMPAKGGQAQLTDEQVTQAVDYMLSESGAR